MTGAVHTAVTAPSPAASPVEAFEPSGRIGRYGLLRPHPNVVAIHEAGEHEGCVYLAMERISGDTLRAWRGERARGLVEILEVALQAARGLAAAHDAGLLVVSRVAAWQAHVVIAQHRRSRFDEQVRRIESAVQQRMTAYVQVLRGGLGLFHDRHRAATIDELDGCGPASE